MLIERRDVRIEGARDPEERHYAETWMGKAFREAPALRPKAEACVQELYRAAGFTPPDKFMWVKSPTAMSQVLHRFAHGRRRGPDTLGSFNYIQKVRQHLNMSIPYWDDLLAREIFMELSREKIREVASQTRRTRLGSMNVTPSTPLQTWLDDFNNTFRTGQSEVLYFPQFSSYIISHLDVQTCAPIKTLLSVACAWMPFRGFALLCERPLRIYLDDFGRFHNPDAMAIRWPDETGCYFINGIEIRAEWVLKPHQTISVESIESQTNAELRRIMIGLYGDVRYLKESGAEVVSHGRNGAKLWSRPDAQERIFQMVEVINSSPEPDGTFKHYFIRVPPEVRTADEGVAWTAGMSVMSYKPKKET